MTRDWELVIAVSSVTMLCKASGALLHPLWRGPRGVHGREMGRLLPAATLAALLAKELFTHGRSLTIDARVVGVAAAVVATWLRMPPAISIAAAILTTAVMRSLV